MVNFKRARAIGAKRGYRATKPLKTTRRRYARKGMGFVRAVLRSRLSPEVKQVESNVTIYPQNYQNNPGCECTPVSPGNGFLPIGQGVGQGDRIGNKITVMSYEVNMIACGLPYSAITNATPFPQYVRIFFGYNKQSPFVTPTNFSNLFQSGDTTAPPAGTLYDMNARINTDNWAVVKQVLMKCGPAGLTTAVGFNTATNNDYKLSIMKKIRFKVGKQFPQKLIYGDTTNTPTNRVLNIWALACNADGTVFLGTYKSVQVNARVTLRYTDM